MIPHSTIFVPGLYGQYKAWRQDIRPLLDNVEEIVLCGNYIGINEDVADSQDFRGYNLAMLKYLNTFTYSSERTTQLVGPNEIIAMVTQTEDWKYARHGSVKILYEWWLDSNPSLTTSTVVEDQLVSHAGLTYGQWVSIGKPDTAQEASERLNEKFDGTLFQGQSYSLTGKPNMSADPIFANPYYELYPSWIGHEACPFNQIHASGDLNTRTGRAMLHDELSIVSFVDSVQYKRYGSIAKINDTTFRGIDLLLNGKRRNSLDTHRNMLVEVLSQ